MEKQYGKLNDLFIDEGPSLMNIIAISDIT